MAGFMADLGAAADSIGYIVALNSAIDTVMGDVLDNAKQMMIDIFPAVKAALILYVVLWGVSAMRGTIGEPIQDGFIRIFKIWLVILLAANIGFYNDYVLTVVRDTPDKIFQQVTGMSTSATTIVAEAFNFIFSMGKQYFSEATDLGTNGIPNLPLLFMGAASWGAGITASAAVIATLVLAKLMLAVLLATGPVFVVLILFDATRRLFDAWLGQLIKYMVTYLLLGFAILIVFEIVKNALLTFLGLSALNIVLGAGGTTLTPIQGTGVIALFVLAQKVIGEIPGIADTLGRSISTNLLTGMPKR